AQFTLPIKPLEIDTVILKNSNEIELTFNKIVDESSAQTILNFVVNHNISNPSSVQLLTDKKTVKLLFSASFPNGVECAITASGINDPFVNTMEASTKSFLFFQPVPASTKDIIISEILADPSPAQQLPEAEF